MSSIILVDCNNFFVSCELLFNPKLRKKPVVVLSNNDGCVVSRSYEAKQMGIQMGQPFFELPPTVHRCSANFSLYSDLSHRVMETLHTFDLPMEINSVDEAFLEAPPHLALPIREKILKWTGLPTSIGGAPTKTLAKVANALAKKSNGICTKPTLDNFPIEDVWGIGQRIARKLKSFGIQTAQDFIQKDDVWIRKTLSVNGLRTAHELRGEPCIHLNAVRSSRKSILCSRSFKHPITALPPLKEAISTFLAKGARKLRKEKLFTSHLTLILGPISGHITLPNSVNDTPTLLRYASLLLPTLYNPDISYKRAGILLTELTQTQTRDLFAPPPKAFPTSTLDLINQKMGKRALIFGAEGLNPTWTSKSKNQSPQYTTDWSKLLIAH